MSDPVARSRRRVRSSGGDPGNGTPAPDAAPPPDAVTPPDVADLQGRAATAERELAAVRERSARERQRLEVEIARLHALLDERTEKLRRTRESERRLRSRRFVRFGVGVLHTLRVPSDAARTVARSVASGRDTVLSATGLAGLVPVPTGSHHVRASRGDERRLATAMRDDLPPPPSPRGGRVSVIVVAGSADRSLRRCVDAVRSTAWDGLEIILAGTDKAALARALANEDRSGAERGARLAIGETVDEARRAAIGMAEGPYVCILHTDAVPLEPGWLARMIDVMESCDAGVVGARLVLPRRPGPPTAPLAEPPDLTLESRGIELDAAGGLPRPRHVGAGEDPRAADARSTGTVPAVASACLLVRRADLDPVDDLLADDAAWAVDLCLRLRAQGRTVAYAGDAVLWHAGQADASDDPTIDSTGPWDAFDRRWARRLFREVLRDRVRGTGDWAGSPIHVAITVTRNDDGIPYGDAYTARELGDALRALGWRVSYIERYKDHWYDLDPSVDVVIALLDLFDVRRVPRHVVKVAWVRNWADRWLSHPWFDDYDLVFGVSGPVQRLIRERSAKVAHLMPLATNEARFRPAAEDPALSTDVVFVGSNWGEERGVARALPALASDGVRTRLFGRGWEDVPGMTGVAGGVLPYERVPDAYASAAIVIDDTASPTRPYGAVNARVFDALAAGRIVVSDNAEGVRELFDADFPVWDDPSTLKSQVRELLADPDRRGELARRYRKEVLGRHTYSHRAAELRERLLEWADRPHVAIHIGPRDWEQAQGWGDTAFGRAVQRQFERAGWPAAVLVHAEAEDPVAVRADVALHVFGVRAPTVRPDQASLLWIISHPDRVTADLCDRYDRVFVASDVFLARLQARVGVPLMPLHQASDPERFYPDPTGPSHQLLFVGNSRKVHRPVLDFLAGTPWDLAVYGQNWTPDLLDPKFLKGEWIPNEDVRHYYSSAEIVLNDHWQDMRDDGFISNRVYDALASGAFVVSDHVPGIDEEFDGGVVTYEDRPELLAKIERYLADPRERRALAERGRRAVLERHTFEHRVRAILAAIEPLLERRPMAVTPTDVTGAAAG